MSDRLRAAVVGVGYLGRFHAQKYKALSDSVELVGVYDVDQARARQVAEEVSCSVFTELKELVGRVDIATVATNTPRHFEAAEFLLESGIHVNVEKPLCLNTQDAQSLIEIAQRRRLHLAVGHSERFNHTWNLVCERGREHTHLNLRRLCPYKVRGSDVSVVMDMMVHDLDLALDWAGVPFTEIKSLRAHGASLVSDSLDVASAQIEFANGKSVNIQSSRVHDDVVREASLFGPSGQIWADLGKGRIREVLPHSVRPQSEPVVEVIEPGPSDALLAETTDFVEAVRQERAPRVDGFAGLAALELVQRVHDVISQSGH